MPHQYDVIIGLEIHTELKTESKMFCACRNEPLSERPNINTCPICLGHPGSLPAVNRQAVTLAVLLGLALKADINRLSKFDRKNYFYPDLPKGYQISQYDQPLCQGGFLNIGPNRDIAITRMHLEEDTGKLIHGQDNALVDLNRAGIPLIEMVTEPVIKTAAEAKEFCRRFQQILRYLNISDADMEKGLMRCEANVSLQKKGSWIYEDGLIKPTGQDMLNHKVEVKNINSFKALERAIEFEIKRQSAVLDNGGEIEAETRGWDDSKNETKAQRKKETQADYRYFPEPDIPPLMLDEKFIETARDLIAELPFERVERLAREYGLNETEAEFFTDNRELGDYYEKVVSELRADIQAEGDEWQRQNRKLAKTTYNWLATELSKHLNSSGLGLSGIKIKPEKMAALIMLVYLNRINSSAGQTILSKMFEQGGDPNDWLEKLGLKQIDDQQALQSAVEKVLTDNPKQADELKAGKVALLKFFIGKVMAETGGKANPEMVEQILKKLHNL